MTAELYIAFVVAAALLMAIPGPDVALIAATSLAHGTRYGLMTVAGTTSAVVVQLIVVGMGLNGFLLVLSHWFPVLRWLGVAYLIVLGICMWRAPQSKGDNCKPKAGAYRAVLLRGCLVSLTNPKTLLFYGAFFPQFIVPGNDTAQQIFILAITFIVIALLVDSIWALAASRIGESKFISNAINNRLAGGLLIGAGLGLALARKT